MVPAQRGEPGDCDLRHSEIYLRDDSCIDAVGRGIYTSVYCQNGLIEAVESELGLVDPPRAQGPGPVRSQHLGTGPGLRLPERLQHRDVSLGLNAVANEISARKYMTLADVEIHLD